MLLSWRPQARSVGLLAPVATGTCALLLLTTGGPSAVWRHSPIGAGRVELRHLAPNSVRDWSNARRRVVLWEADGVESSVALIADEGYAFVVNGKTDGSARLDAPTQVMGGLVGALLHPDPRRALVVGLGTGSTAGWLAAVPSIERVDIVELEPVIVEVARAMTPVNQDVLDNPKTAIIIADAREVLLTTPQRYDLVFSEPSNPYRAGIASLFTREFYQAVAERLAVDGIFLQWVQAYEVDAQTIRTIYATLAAVFPHVETWYTQDRDLLLVASMDPVVYDVPSLRRRVEEEPYRTALAAVWRTTGLEGFLARFGARASLAREVARREENYLNTDDWTLVEFAFARSVGKPALFNTAELRAVARMRNEDRPEVSGGEIDWELVEDRRLTQFTVDGMVAPPDPAGPAERQQRAEAQAHYLHGRMAEALAAWRAQPREPEGPLEILVVAEALARGGDDAALPYIAELRRFQPVEADGLTATLRWKQGKPDAAAESLIAAFTRYRDDPWPLPGVMSRVLDVAAQVGAERGDLAQQLHDALSLPFAARLLEQKRLLTLVRLTRSLDESCQSAWATLEPHVPWERDLLWQRFVCYRDADDPLLAAAEEDLKQFLAAVPMPFATGIEAPPAYASP
jgi:spermidine synthase